MMKRNFGFVCLGSLLLIGGLVMTSNTAQATEIETDATVEVRDSESGTVKFKNNANTYANIVFEKLDLKSSDIGEKTQKEFVDAGKEAAKIVIEDTRKNYPAGSPSIATLSVKAEDAASTANASGMLTNNMTLKLQPKTTLGTDVVSITNNTIELDKNNKDGGTFLELPYKEGSAEEKEITLDPVLRILKVEDLETKVYGTTLTWTLDTSKL